MSSTASGPSYGSRAALTAGWSGRGSTPWGPIGPAARSRCPVGGSRRARRRRRPAPRSHDRARDALCVLEGEGRAVREDRLAEPRRRQVDLHLRSSLEPLQAHPDHPTRRRGLAHPKGRVGPVGPLGDGHDPPPRPPQRSARSALWAARTRTGPDPAARTGTRSRPTRRTSSRWRRQRPGTARRRRRPRGTPIRGGGPSRPPRRRVAGGERVRVGRGRAGKAEGVQGDLARAVQIEGQAEHGVLQQVVRQGGGLGLGEGRGPGVVVRQGLIDRSGVAPRGVPVAVQVDAHGTVAVVAAVLPPQAIGGPGVVVAVGLARARGSR